MIRKLKMKEKVINSKSGYVSIEAVFAMSVFIIFFLLSISFFAYLYPQSQLQGEVEVLSLLCQRQGGLTEDDIANFEDSLRKYSFIDQSDLPIVVTAKTSPSGFDAIGVTDLEDEGDNYVKRESKEIINLVVQIPANNGLLKNIAQFFGIDSVNDYYYYFEPVMSERY